LEPVPPPDREQPEPEPSPTQRATPLVAHDARGDGRRAGSVRCPLWGPPRGGPTPSETPRPRRHRRDHPLSSPSTAPAPRITSGTRLLAALADPVGLTTAPSATPVLTQADHSDRSPIPRLPETAVIGSRASDGCQSSARGREHQVEDIAGEATDNDGSALALRAVAGDADSIAVGQFHPGETRIERSGRGVLERRGQSRAAASYNAGSTALRTLAQERSVTALAMSYPWNALTVQARCRRQRLCLTPTMCVSPASGSKHVPLPGLVWRIGEPVLDDAGPAQLPDDHRISARGQRPVQRRDGTWVVAARFDLDPEPSRTHGFARRFGLGSHRWRGRDEPPIGHGGVGRDQVLHADVKMLRGCPPEAAIQAVAG
jgi:hypothetical protein